MEITPKLARCVNEIKEWSRLNGLKLNTDKTEVLHITSRFRKKIPLESIEVGGTLSFSVRKARNLGVIFDDEFTLQDFVNSKCRLASFALYKIGKLRPYLDQHTTEKLVHAFVMCHLDYCNSLLGNMPEKQLSKLQVIQNSAARLITCTKKFESISPVLKTLHWLPIRLRIIYKLLLFAYQCYYGASPTYLSELLSKYESVRSLRSGQKDLFIVPHVFTKSYGERSFSYIVPFLWNNIPCSLKRAKSLESFKVSLKTYLFDT